VLSRFLHSFQASCLREKGEKTERIRLSASIAWQWSYRAVLGSIDVLRLQWRY